MLELLLTYLKKFREIIARGWTSTSSRLEKMNDELSHTKSELDKTSKVNFLLRMWSIYQSLNIKN